MQNNPTHYTILGAWSSGPVHISGRRSKTLEISEQNPKIIQTHDDSFNEVEDRSIIRPIVADKRVIRGKVSPSKIKSEDNEPDYSPDILDNGK